jgi:hypothetical protein
MQRKRCGDFGRRFRLRFVEGIDLIEDSFEEK